MKGSTKVIEKLNAILTNELTAINQYFLHARMLDNWGFKKLGKHEYDSSIDEMKHADELIKRILFLEGLPNVQKMHKVNIGQSLEEVLNADLKLEEVAIPELKEAIKACESEVDFVSRDLVNKILTSEEHHLDWLETQINLIKELGVANYKQSQINPDQGPEA
ncbi:MAG: bacterioferritin [Bacteriovoracaceae bacterium]|nr:bacterioferritin [Bacteriovoracaceae bacterium]